MPRWPGAPGRSRGGGSVQGRALAKLLLGEVELMSGRLEQAEEYLLQAAELHGQASALSGQSLALIQMAAVAVSRGQLWRARRLLQGAFRLAEASPLSPDLRVRALGGLVAAAGDVPRSMAAVQRADAALAGLDVCPPCSMGFRVTATITLARAGDLRQARARLEEAERIAGMWQGGPWLASTWEARAVLRRAEGDDEQARALFKEAANQFSRMRRHIDEAPSGR